MEFDFEQVEEHGDDIYETDSETEDFYQEEEEGKPEKQVQPKTFSAQDASNFGVYYNDNYNYLQHLKPVGQDPAAVLLTVSEKNERKGISFVDEGAKAALDSVTMKNSITRDAFASSSELEVGLMNQEATMGKVPFFLILGGLQLDLDPTVRDVFTALDDEAYVEDLDEDFFDAFHAQDVPEKWTNLPTDEDYYAKLRKENGAEDEEQQPWMDEFNK